MAKNKGKKRGLLLGEIRIQRRVSKEGKVNTLVRQFDNNGNSLEYFDMAGMMAVAGKHLDAMYEYEED